MDSTLKTLIDRLDTSDIGGTTVIRSACPIPSFGDLSSCRVATLGINPSNQEFVDRSGKELQGKLRRFHTLKSLGVSSWAEVDARHRGKILELCRTYFRPDRNPYWWFKKLDKVVAGAKASYYDSSRPACHLDLVPYATMSKWSDLRTRQKRLLLAVAGDTLGRLLRDSPVRILILNGRCVVEQFQKLAGTTLPSQEMPSWSLRSGSKSPVAFKGEVDSFSGIDFGRKISVLGFTHNLQGSHGMTTEVAAAIREWIAQASEQTLP